jgi:hypothetical protein|tara:strand:- start:470 stop:664 length:195 start_codon:yes stop_codon:yes gene_type:complete
MGNDTKKSNETELPKIKLFDDFKGLIIDFRIYEKESMVLIDGAKKERADVALKGMFKIVQEKLK